MPWNDADKGAHKALSRWFLMPFWIPAGLPYAGRIWLILFDNAWHRPVSADFGPTEIRRATKNRPFQRRSALLAAKVLSKSRSRAKVEKWMNNELILNLFASIFIMTNLIFIDSQIIIQKYFKFKQYFIF